VAEGERIIKNLT